MNATGFHELEQAPPPGMTSRMEGDLMEISMGPQHPSTHGVFRMNVALEGEVVRKLKPVFGYLHRNHEKIGENTTYVGSMPYTDRLDYFCSMTNNWAYALSVEKLAAIEVPERVMLVMKPMGGPFDWQAFFHEAGHAEHFANTSPDLKLEEKRLGDKAVTEGWASLLQHVEDRPGHDRRAGAASRRR